MLNVRGQEQSANNVLKTHVNRQAFHWWTAPPVSAADSHILGDIAHTQHPIFCSVLSLV